MIFGRFAITEAEGITLAHTLRLPGRLLKKGRVLCYEDIQRLQQLGIDSVTGARLEAGDVSENEAALKVASSLAGSGLRIGKPVAGRCNLYARSQGLVHVDRERIDAINLAGGEVAIATLSPNDEAEQGQAVATIKIIPFAISQAVVESCCQRAQGDSPVLSIRPFIPHRVALILTEAENVKTTVLDATRDVMHDRVSSYNSALTFEQRCAHNSDAVEQALRAALASGCELILVCGATITVDVGDVVPSAITRIGGEIEQFGMPVEPGNMLLLAKYQSTVIINLPGCSRSPKLNGFDWVLQRVLAGVAVSRNDIMLMGVGGLIKDVPHIARKQRVISPVDEVEEPIENNMNESVTANVAAIILAAGTSRRMGNINKLLAVIDGKPMVAHVVEAAQASDIGSVLVVTGHQADAVQQALAGSDAGFVYNPEYATGMASSLRTGIAALAEDVDAAIILLADMPFINADQINSLLSAFNPDSENDIVAPVRDGRRGNPVLWARRYFDEILILEGDTGARHLLKKYADHIIEQPVNNDAVLIDIDTSEMLGDIKETGKAE